MCRGCRADSIHHTAAAYGLTFNLGRDGIPIDEGKRDSAVACGNPSSAAGFGRTYHPAPGNDPFSRWQSGDAREFFIAIHSQRVTAFPGDERYGTHGFSPQPDTWRL